MRGDSFNYVVLDNERGSYELMQHLLDLGYREIAIINGPLNVSTGFDRFKGYQKALRERNIALNSDYVINGSWSRSLGYEGAKRLLKSKKRPEAIFGANDHIALGVIDAAEELGFRIPEDIALVGFDDTEFASNRRIGLTTVSQRKYEMGSLSLKILVDYIEGKEKNYVHKIVLEPQLVIRESCGQRIRSNI
jgi:LacI family transcriptional regulator